MDTKGWVLRAVEKLRFASEKDIQRWLDEEGETLSKEELKKALEALLREQRLELKGDVYRLKNKEGGQDAFSKLFNE